MRALVIEDEKVTRLALARMLVGMGFEVVEASDGQCGISAFQDKGPFDVALIDWIMPETSGLDVVRTVRANPAHNNTQLMMVTAKNEMDDIAVALENGAAEYLMKPVEREALEDKLRLLGVLEA